MPEVKVKITADDLADKASEVMLASSNLGAANTYNSQDTSSQKAALAQLTQFAATQEQEKQSKENKARRKSFAGKVKNLLGRAAPPPPVESIDTIQRKIIAKTLGEINYLDTGMSGVPMHSTHLDDSYGAAVNYILIQLLRSRAVNKVAMPTKENNFWTVKYTEPGAHEPAEFKVAPSSEKATKSFKSVEELLLELLKLHAAKIDIPEKNNVKLIAMNLELSPDQLKEKLLALIMKLKEVKAQEMKKGGYRGEIDLADVSLGDAVDKLTEKLVAKAKVKAHVPAAATTDTTTVLFRGNPFEQFEEKANEPDSGAEFSGKSFEIFGWKEDYETPADKGQANVYTISLNGEQFWLIEPPPRDFSNIKFNDSQGVMHELHVTSADQYTDTAYVTGLGVVDTYHDGNKPVESWIEIGGTSEEEGSRFRVVEDQTDLAKGRLAFEEDGNIVYMVRQADNSWEEGVAPSLKA